MQQEITGFDVLDVQIELKRLENLSGAYPWPKTCLHPKLAAAFDKLCDLWEIANRHVKSTDKEEIEKGITAMNLVINLCKETKKYIQPIKTSLYDNELMFYK